MALGFRRAVFAAALVTLVAGVAAGVAIGQTAPPQHQGRGQGMGQGMGPGGGPGGMLQHLNLTDDQKSKVQSLVQQHHQAMQNQAQQLRDLEQQLKNAIFADSGPGDTAALQQQIAGLESQMQTDRIALEKQIAGILTADQRKQVRDMPGPGPFMGGRGMGMGRGRGMHHAPQHIPGF